jgi:hypothetical protein
VDLNETGTTDAETVHNREITVIPDAAGMPGAARDISPDRLPYPEGADISPATPTSAFQGRNHGD